MMFKISSARKEILQKLAERDWTPTDLAEELNKSTETVYNHLDELEKEGFLSKSKIEAKTRPKNLYSLKEGFVQYVGILPNEFISGSITLDENKAALFRIWEVPQEEFHLYLEKLWWEIKTVKEVKAIALYGSVARGEAHQDSDVDILLIVDDKKESEKKIKERFGSTILETKEGSRMLVSEVYQRKDYRKSKKEGSDFLQTIKEDLHPIHDPEELL